MRLGTARNLLSQVKETHHRFRYSQNARYAFRCYSTDSVMEESTDVLIVGSGAGALTAALTAAKQGLRCTVIEKNQTIGGASVISGGGLWIPGNPVSRAAGIRDTQDAALRYFAQGVGDVGAASSIARREAFLENGPKMIEFLQALGLKFHFTIGYPDYYPTLNGAMGEGGGRTIESEVFDERRLGEACTLLPESLQSAPIYTHDAATITRMSSSLSAFTYTVRRLMPLTFRKFMGQKLSSMGRALVAQLLYFNIQAGTTIHVNHAFLELLEGPDGVMTGALIQMPSGIKTVHAKKGIVLAAGGFSQEIAMRKTHLPSPTTTAWSLAPSGDTGDAVKAGIKVGAAISLMDDAWWGPTIFDPVTGRNHFALFERARPFCIIVDSSGTRFMNEAQSYTDAGHDQYERNSHIPSIPAWLIMDANHRKRYMLGSKLFAKMEPTQALDNKKMFKGDTMRELGEKAGISTTGLDETITRYNIMSRKGVDLDFGKGGNAYDRYFGDPSIKPNPNMAPLEKPPFYAIPIWPGDLGTKGGLLADENQRVLREDGSAIPGLYACGNTAASIMGRAYLGAGSTLGPAMTHGFVAVNNIVSTK